MNEHTPAEEFASNFHGNKLPDELSLLFEFEQEHGTESYSECFYLDSDGESALSSWSTDKGFLKMLMPFAVANGSGSVYAFWDEGKGKSLKEMPVVVFGDEGGVHVVGKNILELMQLLTYDTEISVYHDEAYFYKDEEEYQESEYAEAYKNWLKETFNINPVDKPGEIIKSAQDEFKALFDVWFAQYYNE
ncbi:hypothetical protein SAMN05428988_4192 [Chitinophaga sp. YR573]|uniref:hypothetical protein n=1 Tax=Chitinophaga sp. YR573 TaxID=1881040 RepID=UPI0008CD742B|nr:hypothetical protein [Chitinophaga sp. YR573]SEW34701.1 hypothetical protein SAMN05428988_4192 [Chitinophaga sp. YR573]